MRTFAFAAVAVTVAEALHAAHPEVAWAPAVAARNDDSPEPTSMCTGAGNPCNSESQPIPDVVVTNTLTVTNTITVTGTRGSGTSSAKDGPAPPANSPEPTTTVLNTQTKYTVITKTVQKSSQNAASISMPSAPSVAPSASSVAPSASSVAPSASSVVPSPPAVRPSASSVAPSPSSTRLNIPSVVPNPSPVLPFVRNSTSSGYASPTMQQVGTTAQPPVAQFTGAASRNGLGVAALAAGLVAVAQLI